MNKTLAITAIALVAVVMGLSAIAPALLPEAEAHNSGKKLPAAACEAIKNNFSFEKLPPAIQHILVAHC